MSKYTTELRFICESLANKTESEGYNSVADIISTARPKIFNFEYPIFDSNYKPVLETKILKHFYTQEIGYETFGRWKLALDAKLNEIMPYYNKLYESELLKFNPLFDFQEQRVGSKDGKKDNDEVNIINKTNKGTVTDDGSTTVKNDGTTIDNGNTNSKNTGTIEDDGNQTTHNTGNVADLGTSKTTDSGKDKGKKTGGDSLDRWDKFADTPQGSITDLANDKYMTNARHITENHTNSLENTETEYGKTVDGTNNNIRTLNTTNDTDIDNTRTLNTENDVKNSNVRVESNKNTTEADNTKTYDVANNEQGVRNTDIKTHDEYFETVQGKSRDSGSYSKLILEYRNTFINIDLMIIDELSELFMQLW